jgi:hexosaminidase
MTTNGFVSDARLRGCALLPMPRQVEFSDNERFHVDWEGWALQLDGVDEDDVAVRTFREETEWMLDAGSGEAGTFELAVRPGTVETGLTDGRDEQAYMIEISEDRRTISLIANGRAGLFYAVQTYRQICDCVPEPRRIVDWPEYEVRCIHWDTKHHQSRMETLKRYLDQAAAFKINAILFELEDRFEYPSHPIIGAPGAFTTAEMQEIVDYALERYIEIIPDVQSPAHVAYVLKHEEFAHLRCDGSNYQSCMDEPEVRKLLFDMYDDVCAATKGTKYFHVSTDEVYYAGICEKFRKPYNAENRSLTWVDYVNAAHKHITEKWGRQVIVWGEFPLLPEHTKLLPKDLLNGIGGRRPAQVEAENELGMRQFAYVSMQGAEPLFPNYFAWAGPDGAPRQGRIDDAVEYIERGKERMPDAVGIISAAWDDSGLHAETFWLGWAMTTQAAWTPGLAIEEAVASFFDIFYGGALDMGEIYRDLQLTARYYEMTTERLPSKVREPGYGYSDRKTPVERRDRTLVPPPLSNVGNLAFQPTFRKRYAEALAKASTELARSDRLLLRLQSNLTATQCSVYNLEVFISLARLHRQFVHVMLGLASAEGLLEGAAKADGSSDYDRAINLLVDAGNVVRRLVAGVNTTYERTKAVWEKDRFEKGRSVDGRDFVHVMDDVKDHLADRRADLSYLIEWFELMDMPGWLDQLQGIIDTYAAAHRADAVASEEERLED